MGLFICDTGFLFRDGNVQKWGEKAQVLSILEEGNKREEIHLSLAGCCSCSTRVKEVARSLKATGNSAAASAKS